jgi:murein L,D-transpeptidase YcbB/YkuD
MTQRAQPCRSRAGRTILFAAGLLFTCAGALRAVSDGARPAPVAPAATATATARAGGDSLESALAALLARSAPPAPIGPHLWRHVRALYGDRPSARWLDGAGGAARIGALLGAMRSAPAEAVRLPVAVLDALDSAAAALARRGDPAARAHADVFLTAAFAAYAETMLTGQVSPKSAGAAWHIDPDDVDVDSALAHTLRDRDLAPALARLLPREEGYATLRDALARYRDIVRSGGWPRVSASRTVHPGDTLHAAPVLRARLAAEGHPAGGTAVPSDTATYDEALAAAVARFQARHGLAVDSVLGPRTLAALDVTAGERLRQIAANMERYRWLPPELGERVIVVNIPAFRLDAYDGARRSLSMRVVVGAELEYRRTPIFADTMRYVQFGPYWNVPRNIALREIIPHVVRDRGYLARNDYEVVRGWGDDAPVVDAWTLSDAELRSHRYRIRQRPGPRNALGRVKFLFPNDFNVYLHDTPARQLFDERVRTFSHGCVRVADPAALAAFVLQGHEGWTPERIRSTLASGERVRVTLDDPLPVYLVYLTAFAQDGALAFRADRYDQDDSLMRALGAVPTGERAPHLDAVERAVARTLSLRRSGDSTDGHGVRRS